MTFYEAALRVLEQANGPMGYQQITEHAQRGGLLSHEGKEPDQTMLARLLAMARRPAGRRIVAVDVDTFALADWQLPEKPGALEGSGQTLVSKRVAEAPLRPPERHPPARSEIVRSLGKDRDWRRRDERRSLKKKATSLPESVVRALQDKTWDFARTVQQTFDHLRTVESIPPDVRFEEFRMALALDNQRRAVGGHSARFYLQGIPPTLRLFDATAGTDAPAEVETFVSDLGFSPEALSERLQKETVQNTGFDESADGEDISNERVATLLAETVGACSPAGFHRTVVHLLRGLRFRELRTLRRGKGSVAILAKRKEGFADVRYYVRLLSPGPADRQTVHNVRKEAANRSAHIGVLVGASEPRKDAKAEAGSGGVPVFLWCGRCLGERLMEARVGVQRRWVEVFEPSPAFFEEMEQEAAAHHNEPTHVTETPSNGTERENGGLGAPRRRRRRRRGRRFVRSAETPGGSERGESNTGGSEPPAAVPPAETPPSPSSE